MGDVKYQIEYRPLIIEYDLKKIDKNIQLQIRNAIEKKLTTTPEIFGKPLRNTLKHYRSLRVNKYRIIFKITGSTIVILAILPRSNAYSEILKRIP